MPVDPGSIVYSVPAASLHCFLAGQRCAFGGGCPKSGVTSNSLFGFHKTPKISFCPRTRNCFKAKARDVCSRSTSQVLFCKAAREDEFKSSRNIALGLHKRYKDVVDGGFANLREFVDAGVTAYAIGCTDEGLRKELLNVCKSDSLEVTDAFELNLQLKARVRKEEIEDCILWLCIVFITIMCTPQPTVVRWSSSPAVSAEARLQWRGFCALIADAYYTRGMAWMPIKTLQLEQLAVAGRAEEPALVADRMRLVFATLEIVSPQWPKK